MRLSSNRTFGDSDDILLGEFARVETFLSGNRVVFSGPLNLSLEIPAGSYHLAVRVDPLEDIAEADEENNVVFTDQRDITILRLPDLLVDFATFLFDNSKIYYPEDRFILNYDIINRGLGDIGGSPFTSSITARAITPAALIAAAGDPDEVLANSQEIAVFGNFTHQAFLPGRSSQPPNGASLKFHAELTLPTERQIIDAVPIPAAETIDSRVYFVTITVDAGGDIDESGERNVILFFGLTFVIVPSPVAQTEILWRADYEAIFGAFVGGPLDDEEPDGIVNLLEYAFNLNPFVADSAGTDVFNNFGFILDNNDLYLNVTFDIVKAATDLTYVVETTNDLSPGGMWTPLLALPIVPPFLSDTGVGSLTGPGGLESSDDKILAVSDQGYTARITIRDGVKVENIAGNRFLRINVNGVNPLVNP